MDRAEKIRNMIFSYTKVIPEDKTISYLDYLAVITRLNELELQTTSILNFDLPDEKIQELLKPVEDEVKKITGMN